MAPNLNTKKSIFIKWTQLYYTIISYAHELLQIQFTWSISLLSMLSVNPSRFAAQSKRWIYSNHIWLQNIQYGREYKWETSMTKTLGLINDKHCGTKHQIFQSNKMSIDHSYFHYQPVPLLGDMIMAGALK